MEKEADMAYEKRVCVLKQIKKGFAADGGSLSGAVYCERLGETLTVTPRILGLAPVNDGYYALGLWIASRTFCLELAGNEPLRIEKAPSIRGGFCALVCFVRGEGEPVAFGACGDAPTNYAGLLSAVNGEKRPIPNPLPPTEVPLPSLPNAPRAPGVPLPGPEPSKEEPKEEKAPFRPQKYDDDAIAASDYYHDGGADKDENAVRFRQEKEGEIAGGGHPSADETPLLPRGSLTYYNTVRERLEAAMKKFPADTRLQTAFPLSEWVRAESGALLGIIYERGVPRYLCVAVEKTGDPPAEMQERCAFVPTSPYSDEEGFWVVFQDADTGEYIKVSEN